MAPVSPLPLALNDGNFIKRLRECAADSSKVKVTVHAKARMRRRNIVLSQVLACLRQGHISERAHLTIHGDWKATLEHQVAGDIIKVAVALTGAGTRAAAIVVTVID